MPGLLRAELETLANLVLHREGRRLLVSVSISLAFLGLVSSMFGAVVAQSPDLLELVGDRDPTRVRALFGSLLLPGVFLTIWFGFSGGRRLLFERAPLDLLLQSPLGVPWILVHALLRFSLLTTLWCVVLCGPVYRAVCGAIGLPFSWWHLVVASWCLTTPIVAVLLALEIALLRWFASRLGQLVVGMLSALSSTAFSLLLLVGAVAREDSVGRLVALARGRVAYPLLIDAPAGLLADHSLAIEPTVGVWVSLAVAPLIGVATTLLVGFGYRRAYANARQSFDPLFATRWRRSWPARPSPAMFRKELAQLVHQPSQLIGLLVSAMVIVVVAGSRFVHDEVLAGSGVPESVRHVFLMLGLWLFAQLTVVPGCLVRMTVTDSAQWPLYVGAPVRSSTILRGKLWLVALLQAWPAVVVLFVGKLLFDASATSFWLFAAVLPALLLWTTAATGAVGTLPFLMRPQTERNHALVLVAVVLMLFLLQVTAFAGVRLWLFVRDYYHGIGPFAGFSTTSVAWLSIGLTWVVSLCLSGMVLTVGARNFAALRAPNR